MIVYRSAGKRFLTLKAAADAVAGDRVASNRIMRAIGDGYRYRGHWYSRSPIAPLAIEGEHEEARCHLVFSSDGRTWINARYASQTMGARHATALEYAVKHRTSFAGLYWSKASVADARAAEAAKAESRRRQWSPYGKQGETERAA